jgi:hypothetical protein
MMKRDMPMNSWFVSCESVGIDARRPLF